MKDLLKHFLVVLSLMLLILSASNAQKKTNYEALWSEVENLKNEGKTNTAIEKTTFIIEIATKEGNEAQRIRALLERLYFRNLKEEDSFIQALNEIEKEVKTGNQNSRAILHSALAEMYWWYYANNRWTVLERTNTEEIKSEDIETWTAKDLVEACDFHYSQSLLNSDFLKKTPVSDYEVIWVKGENSRVLRPTLYDLLLHRALDFYSNEQSGLTIPGDQFVINDASFFEPASDFINRNWEKQESISFDLKSLELYQAVISFHLAAGNEDAIIYNDLERLKYIFRKYAGTDRDTLFETALTILSKNEKSEISAEVYYELAVLKVAQAGQYHPKLHPEYQFHNRAALKYIEQALNKFPDSRGSLLSKELSERIKEKSFQVNFENIIYPAKEILFSVRYKNLNKLYFRIVSNNENILGNSGQLLYEQDVKYFTSKKAIRQWSADLPDSSDFQFHSIELMADGLENGYYALIASADPDFKSSQNLISCNLFWNSHFAYFMTQENDGGAKIFVVDRISGLPLKNVRASLFEEIYDYNRRSQELKAGPELFSDEDGKIAVPAQPDQKNYRVLLSESSDSLLISNTLYVRQNKERKEKSVLRTALFTDRIVYRPGQFIYFKGLLMEKTGQDVKLVSGMDIPVKLLDNNNQEVGKVNLTTTEFGSFHGSFILPPSVLTGHFFIDDGISRHTVQIEEYKRPSFFIEFTPFSQKTRLGEEVHINGMVKSYSDVPLSGAKGSYHVQRQSTAITPYFRIKPYPESGVAEIKQGDFVVDENGNFEISFKALPDNRVSKKNAAVFLFTVELSVTDLNGETQSDQIGVNIGYHTLKLGTDLGDHVEKRTLDSVEIFTRNLMDVHSPAEVSIQIRSLIPPERPVKTRLWDEPDFHVLSKEEMKKLFPYDPFENEGEMENWKTGNEVYTTMINTFENKKTSLKLWKEIKSGPYEIELLAKDPYGQEVRYKKRFVVFDDEDNVKDVPEFFRARLSGEELRAGEQIRLLVSSAMPKSRFYCSVSNKNGTRFESWNNIGNTPLKMTFGTTDADIGTVIIQLLMIREGRVFMERHHINVVDEKTKLTLKLHTTRSGLNPGDTESWSLSVTGYGGKATESEVLASMYDMSLDVIRPFHWSFNPIEYYTPYIRWEHGNSFQLSYAREYSYFESKFTAIPARTFDQLNWFGFSYYGRGNYYMRSMAMEMTLDEEVHTNGKIKGDKSVPASAEITETAENQVEEEAEKANIQPVFRTDFRETAFFYPELKTDTTGQVEFKFEVPDGLTRWKLQVLAHTKDLKYGMYNQTFISQKDLMVVPNYPRFLTAGDTIEFSARISNLSGEALNVKTEISVFDPVAGQPAKNTVSEAGVKMVQIGPKQNELVKWQLITPSDPGLLEIAVYADGQNHRDGEMRTIPVLSKSILVTETYPVALRPGTEKSVFVQKLAESTTSIGIEPERLTVEFTPNPSWYVVQALPYLADPGDESSGQIFNRYYANAIGFHIMNSNEKIKKVFELWKQSDSETFLSRLEQNAELKNIVLSESPWLLEAESESEDKRKIGLFFDENNLRYELSTALFELLQLQTPNGGWPWFSGMTDNRCVTQQIVMGMGRLSHLGISDISADQNLRGRLESAIYYTDQRIDEDYKQVISKLKNPDENHLSALNIQYLFARSYFREIKLKESEITAYNYYYGQAKKYWLSQNKYLQAMLALVFHRNGDVDQANKILTSFRENALQSDEFGMYWKKENGYNWYESDVEKQAMIIEAFEEISKDMATVDEMKIWLLKQKQSRMWRTGRATTEACYALLLRGSDLLSSGNNISLSVGTEKFELPVSGKSEAGTSYTKLNWKSTSIKSDMKDVKFSNTGSSISWGAVYFQYFQSSDKLEEFGSALTVNREIYVKRYNKEGPVLKKVSGSVFLERGETVVIKLIIKSDRDLEFVHLKDMRAAGLEPVAGISGFQYSGGLSYYLSVRDAASHFYISYLNRGTYVMEYELKADNAGKFATGISTIQCYYAPEFSAHSRGQRIEIK